MWGEGGAYDAWAAMLQQWAEGEPADVDAPPAMTPELFTGDGWERIGNRFTGAIDRRLQRWAAALTRALGEARSEFEYARALVQARDGLRAVRALTGRTDLPDELTTALRDMVDRQVRSMQESLEEQVERLRRSGAPLRQVDARLRTVRENGLTAVLTEPAAAGSPPAAAAAATLAWAADPSAPRRRHIIVD